MAKLSIRTGDKVKVMAGKDKGKEAKVLATLPHKERVLVEGCRMIKKHLRRSQANPQGKIVEKEGTIHASNVMKLADFEARAAKRGVKIKQS